TTTPVTVAQTSSVAVQYAWGEVDVPERATAVRVVMTCVGVRSNGGNVFGHTCVQLGANVKPVRVNTQSVKYDFADTPDTARSTLVAADIRSVPAGLRGTSQKFYPRGHRDSGSDSGKFLRLDGGSAMVLQYEFMERADQ